MGDKTSSEVLVRVIQLSDSQLSIWYTCNLRYNFEKLMRYRLVGDSHPYLQEGSVIHKMLEVFYRHGIPGPDQKDYSDRIELALNLGTKHAIESEDIDLKGDRLQFIRDSFIQYADHWKQDGWIPRKVEEYFTIELYREEDTNEKEGLLILYEGRVDLMVEIPRKEGLVPVDHKSSSSFKKIKHPSILSGQFIGYAVATDSTEVVENKFGLQTSYEPEQRFIRHPITYDSHVLEEWKAWTVVQGLKMDRCIQAGYFEPNFMACARGCPFTSVCYTRPSLREWKLTQGYIIKPHSDKKVYKAFEQD